jgi:hypothetical protein
MVDGLEMPGDLEAVPESGTTQASLRGFLGRHRWDATMTEHFFDRLSIGIHFVSI